MLRVRKSTYFVADCRSVAEGAKLADLGTVSRNNASE